ncbi:MAG: M28 family peptidase [Chloroflexia bacterium]|nr:M28 family peptidase [Chloroflexia bacterium]
MPSSVDPPANPPSESAGRATRLPWARIGVVMGLVLAVFVVNRLTGTDVATPTPTPTVTAEQANAVPTVAGRSLPVSPEASATVVTPTRTQGTPVATPEQPKLANRCREACLVRAPTTEPVAAILAQTGVRPSYAGGAWLWAVVAKETVARLQDAGVPMTMVRESPETLYLYATRLPAGVRERPEVAAFGTVLDRVDEHAIVRVDKVPARVADLVAAGIWVEKLKPAPPSQPGSAGEGPRLANVDLGTLPPQVDSERIEQTILDLQGMSSNDGTGVGTRYYTSTGNAMAAEYLFRQLEAEGLTVWYEDFLTPEGLLAVNVVGEIPGRDPSAIYGVLAHFDSISTDVSSAPGADDNSTGMASALEIARILAGYELKHSLRIIFVNAEEVGILGTKSFARNAVAEDIPYEGIFNIDSVGSERQGALLILNADGGSAWMEELIVRMNEAYGLGQDMMVRQNPAIVADDNKLRDQGLEAVMVARELYGQSPIHHSPADTAEKVSIPNTVSAAQIVLLSVGALVRE